MKKTIFRALGVLALCVAAAHPAEAHGGFRGGIFIGPIWPVWPVYSYPAPYYAPPVVIREAPETVYVAPQPQEQNYWYYCRAPEGYYPYVKRCPDGWQKVLPSPPAPVGKE